MIEKCARAILHFLPPGVAWNRSESSNLYKVALSLAEEFCRVETRVDDLLRESDPRTTVELITDWERFLGLPGDCIGLPETLQDRRAQIVSRLISRQSQTPAYYVELAETAGYTITVSDIIEYTSYTVDLPVEAEIFGVEWVFVFAIVAPLNTERFFRVESSLVEERLVYFGDDLLECIVTDNKPAHTVVLFIYE